jgi:lysozyme
MSAVDLAMSRLKIAEGYRATPYRDTAGHFTVGYGANLDAGILEPEAAALLQAQIATRATALQSFRGFQGLDDVRQSVLIELAVNLGVNGLLGFSRMLNAVASGDWQTAHDELLASKAATQLPARYGTLAQMLLTGVNA